MFLLNMSICVEIHSLYFLYFQVEGVGFSPTLCESEGVYVLQTVTSALWYIDPHYSTLHEATSSCGKKAVPPIPDRWVKSFHQRCTYNNWQKKKLKQPRMDRTTTAAHARALFSVAQKPCVAGSVWQAIRSDIEILASVLQGYSDYLATANEKQQERHAQLCPVRQLSEHILVTCHDGKPYSSLSPDERKLNDLLIQEEAYSPVFFDEEKMLGKVMRADQRYRLVKYLSITRRLDVL